jgi:hypothetical protein
MSLLRGAVVSFLLSGLVGGLPFNQPDEARARVRRSLSGASSDTLKQLGAASALQTARAEHTDGRGSAHRQLDLVDDIAYAILASPNIATEMENVLDSTLAVTYGYTDEADFVHDVVAVILHRLGYPVDLTGVQLPWSFCGTEDQAHTGAERANGSFGIYYNDTGGFYYNETGTYLWLIDLTDDYCGGTGTDCPMPYDDTSGFNGIKGGSMDSLLEDMGFSGLVNQSLVDSTCPLSSGDVTQPLCAFNTRRDVGAWTCRTLFSPLSGAPVQWNACVDPGKNGLVTDTCGCCGGVCPVACSFACDLVDGSGTGALIYVKGNMLYNLRRWLPFDLQVEMNVTETTACVPAEIAVSLDALLTNDVFCLAPTV